MHNLVGKYDSRSLLIVLFAVAAMIAAGAGAI
jgi:hypothetical protein